MSRLLVMIKPWSIKYADEILKELDFHGKRLKTSRVEKVSHKTIAQQYYIYQERDFYPYMINDFHGLPVVLAVYEGKLEEFSELKNQLREKYNYYIPFNPNHQRNAIHISSTEDECSNDLKTWDKFLV